MEKEIKKKSLKHNSILGEYLGGHSAVFFRPMDCQSVWIQRAPHTLTLPGWKRGMLAGNNLQQASPDASGEPFLKFLVAGYIYC